MSAPPTTQYQVNFKTPGGTLVNLYADGTSDLDAQLQELANRVPAIVATEQLLTGAGVVGNVIPLHPQQPVSAPAGPPPDWAVPAPQQVVSQAAPPAAPQCPHGARVYRVSKDPNNPWQGWFCPSPKGTPGQCKPEFIGGR